MNEYTDPADLVEEAEGIIDTVYAALMQQAQESPTTFGAGHWLAAWGLERGQDRLKKARVALMDAKAAAKA